MEGLESANSPYHGIDTKEYSEKDQEGRILDVQTLPLLGVQPDIIVTVEDTPPDVVFQPPPRPKPVEPPIVPSGSSSAHPRRFPTYDDLTLLFSSRSVGAVLVAGGALVVIRLVVRARHSRREFVRELDRLEGSSEESSRDPARDKTTAQGTLSQREQEAERRVYVLKGLVTDVAKANKRCPWEPRGDSRKRLIACSNKLSKALARVEHALEELRIMNEIEGLISDIDSVGGRGSGANGEGFFPLDDDMVVGGYETMENESGPEGGSGEGNSAQRRTRLQKQSSSLARLPTRVKALLSMRSEDASRCVFKQELKQWCNTLATREKATKDRLKHALGEWNLTMVDVALEQLWLLGLPELVKEFREKREDIRSKQWLLRQELKNAQADPMRGDYTSRLRQACAKADAFSGTAFPEYKSAKESLNKAYLTVLEVQAKRIKTLHGLSSDASVNLRLDSSGDPSLLLEDIPEEFCGKDDHANNLALESDDRAPGVDRQLVLNTSGDITSLVHESSSGALQLQQVRHLRAERNSAEAEFLAYLTDREKEFRCSYEADYRDAKDREQTDVYQKDFMKRLDEQKGLEKERIKIEEERLRGEKEKRQREEEDSNRKREEERLRGLWSADGDFLRMLYLVDVVVAVVTTLRRKGFSLVPRVVFDAAWAAVTAECAAEDDAHGGASAGFFYPKKVMPDTCPMVDGIVTDAMLCAGEPGPTQVFEYGYAGRTLWWAWSTAGSTAETLVRGSYSSVGWVLSQTFGSLIPSLGCEAYAVLSLGSWFLSLVLVLKVVGWAGADSHGPAAAVIRLMIVVTWVWGRFHDYVLATSRELFVSAVPPLLILVVYGVSLKYVERHLKPDGCWWMKGWDVRPLVSRVLPAMVSLVSVLVVGCLGVP